MLRRISKLANNPTTRPDIQVLEDRVVRLKSQVESFQGLRLYSVSKERLRKAASELIQCAEILSAVAGPTTASSNATSMPNQNTFHQISEFSSDGDDLNDVLELNGAFPRSYNSKYIVGGYSQRLMKCSFETGCSSGIIQVNQVIQLLNTWYQTRFTPSTGFRNPRFVFKADSIVEWINAFILASGNAIHSDTFQTFNNEVRIWINTLNTDHDPLWAIPYNVKLAATEECTLEAVLLEKMIKPSLYDKSFYLHDMHTIENIYLSTFDVSKDELKISNLINNCNKLIITSSFDINKYEVSD